MPVELTDFIFSSPPVVVELLDFDLVPPAPPPPPLTIGPTAVTLDKRFVTVYTTASGKSGVVEDAPSPEHRDALGSGKGEWRAILPRSWGSLGIPGDRRGTDDLVLSLAGGTRWDTYVQSPTTLASGGTLWGDWSWGASLWGDPPQGLGQLLWSGHVEEITPTQGETEDQVEVLLLPPHRVIADGQFLGSITFTDTDAVLAAKYFFDQGLIPGIIWDGRNQLSGNLITQNFQFESFRQILDFCTVAAGSGWINHVDERGRFRLWQIKPSDPPTHVVQVGREVNHVLFTQSRVLQKNRVTIRAKGGIVATETSREWTAADTRDAVYTFPSITDAATARIVAASLLAKLNQIFVRASITLVSNAAGVALQSISYHAQSSAQPGVGLVVTQFVDGLLLGSSGSRGYLLESIHPGDTIQLWNDQGDNTRTMWGDWLWGTSRWTSGQFGIAYQPQVIQSVSYHAGDTVELDLATPRPSLVTAHRAVQKLAESALAQQVS